MRRITRHRTIFYILFILLNGFAAEVRAERSIRFLDIWDLRPLAGVQVSAATDTVWSDPQGVALLTKALAYAQRLEVNKTGYFPEKITPDQTWVWLTPISRSQEIVATGKAPAAATMGLPAHVSRISTQAAAAGVTANLGELLKGTGGVRVKSYGAAGQLQTVSLRGMSAGQTQISLDGVPLNNLQLGSVDLGLLDLNALGDVFLYRGGSLYLGGSGAIGGAMNIHTADLTSHLGYRLFYERASWANEAFGLRMQLPVWGIRQQISFSRGYGKNNYSAINPNHNVRLQNRDFSRWSGQYQAEYPVSEQIRVSALFLQTKNKRGAPKPFTTAQAETANRARMDTDQNLGKIKFSYGADTSGITLQVYSRNEWMRYHDPSVVINNRALHSLHFNQELGVQVRGRYKPFAALEVLAGSEAAWYKVNSTDAGRHRRFLQSAYLLGIYGYTIGNSFITSIQLRPGVRLEREDAAALVWLPGMGISVQTKAGELYVSAGKNFRRPTLNDLYWTPGGNPDLHAETSRNYETGFKHLQPFGEFIWQAQAAVFRNDVRDQIKWMPIGGVWQPQNLSAVLSRGVELSTEIAHFTNRHKIRSTYSFVQAEKYRPDTPEDQTVGNQLPYIPRERFTIEAQSGYGAVDAGLLFTGSSFSFVGIANDPAQIIPSWHTLDVWFLLSKTVQGHHVRLKAMLMNVLNTRYEVVKGYPMPPREFRMSLEIHY